MIAASAERMRAHRRQETLRRLGRDDRDELALIGDVTADRGRAIRKPPRPAAAREDPPPRANADPRLMRDFIQRRRQAAAGGIAHQADRRAGGFDHDRDKIMQRRGVGQHLRFKRKILPLRHDGDAVIADRARQQNDVAGARPVARKIKPAGTTPTQAVEMKTPSALPRSTTLVSPVMIGTLAAREASPMLARCARGRRAESLPR